MMVGVTLVEMGAGAGILCLRWCCVDMPDLFALKLDIPAGLKDGKGKGSDSDQR
jgi:hypothetical protein